MILEFLKSQVVCAVIGVVAWALFLGLTDLPAANGG
jgi:hypothetical protein